MPTHGHLSTKDTDPHLFPKSLSHPPLPLRSPLLLYGVRITLEPPALFTITTKAILSCHEAPLTILTPCHLKRDASPLRFETFLYDKSLSLLGDAPD